MPTSIKLSALLATTALAFPMLAAGQSRVPNIPAPPPVAPAPLPSYRIPQTNVIIAPVAPPANNPGNRTVISPGTITPPSGQNQAPQAPVPAVFVTIPTP